MMLCVKASAYYSCAAFVIFGQTAHLLIRLLPLVSDVSSGSESEKNLFVLILFLAQESTYY